MTPEEEWHGPAGSGRLLELSKRCTHLQPAVKARKYRLIASAIARLFPDADRQRELLFAVEYTEALAEGVPPPLRPSPPPEPSPAAPLSHGDPRRVLAGLLHTDPYGSASQVASAVRWAGYQPNDPAKAPPPHPPVFGIIVRDIFGNPFHPVTADPRWLTQTVTDLASAIYTERAFDRLPVLADALEEAGCDHPDVLTHCRGDGPHVRGCWVVDLVMGKQ